MAGLALPARDLLAGGAQDARAERMTSPLSSATGMNSAGGTLMDRPPGSGSEAARRYHGRWMEGSALTHLDPAGRARMVDVSAKAATERYARARSVVRMSREAAARVAAGDNPKGDVAAVARIAAIQAAKRTDELIPLCHSLPLTHVDPSIAIDAEAGTVTLVVETRTTDRTGVEMEALVAASVGALTVYDMVKGIEPGVVIERVELLDKTGGKADFHRS